MYCSQWRLSPNSLYWWSCGHHQEIETKKQGAFTNLWLPLPNYYSSFLSCFTFFLGLWQPQFCGSPLFHGFYPLIVILPSPEKWALVHFPLWTFSFGHTCSPKNAGFIAKILISLRLWQPQFCGSPLFLGFYPLVVILPSPEKWALVHFPLWTFSFGHTYSPKNAGFIAKILIFLGLWQPQFCGSPLFLGFYPLVVILPSPEKWALVHFPLWTGHF